MKKLLKHSLPVAAALLAISSALAIGDFVAHSPRGTTADSKHANSELARVHQGIVDEATLSRMANGAAWSPSGDVQEASLVPAAFETGDRQAILRYLVQSPQNERRPSDMVAQANTAAAPDTAARTPAQSMTAPAAPAAAGGPSMTAPAGTTPATGSMTAPAAAGSAGGPSMMSGAGAANSGGRGETSNSGLPTCDACHGQEDTNWAHTIHAKVFELSPRKTMGSRGCEACHGPGDAHIQNPGNLATIISFSHKSKTPVQQQNAQCLTCHAGGQRIFWHGSIHENNRLACSDCHNPMTNFSSHGLTARESVNQTCFSCHKVQRAEFNKRSHMPLLEGKLSCTDCHNPHGSTTQPLLKADSVNEVCYGCHAEKRGPFLFEHAPVRENCMNCHSPHGSNFESLLTTPRPILCQQCHAQDGHPAQLLTMGNLPLGARPDPRLIATSCQTCHVNIHGSNSPSGPRFER